MTETVERAGNARFAKARGPNERRRVVLAAVLRRTSDAEIAEACTRARFEGDEYQRFTDEQLVDRVLNDISRRHAA